MNHIYLQFQKKWHFGFLSICDIVNDMVAEGRETHGPRLSAAMVLAQLSRNIPDWAPEGQMGWSNKISAYEIIW